MGFDSLKSGEGSLEVTGLFLLTDTSDLHFKASKDRYGGQPLFSEKFPGLWSGARSTHGVTKGKVCFEAKVGAVEHCTCSVELQELFSTEQDMGALPA